MTWQIYKNIIRLEREKGGVKDCIVGVEGETLRIASRFTSLFFAENNVGVEAA